MSLQTTIADSLIVLAQVFRGPGHDESVIMGMAMQITWSMESGRWKCGQQLPSAPI